jgi:hypothetical protein
MLKTPPSHTGRAGILEGFGDYESYLEWVSGIFASTLEKTRPGGYLAVVVGTVLSTGSGVSGSL